MCRLEPITLRGERTLLEPLGPEHAAALTEAARAPEIWEYMPARVEWGSLEGIRAWIESALAARRSGREMPFAIVDQVAGQAVGSTRLTDFDPANRSVEIGWTWLSPQVWRTRVNTECKALLLTHCFERMGMIRVQLKTDARNVRSQLAIERLGAVKEGVLRHHRIMPDGYLRDSVYYSILAPEWPAVKARLQTFLERS